jgi:hypothetical protein
VRDRTTGAVWRTGATTHATWTASTVKVGIVLDLLERHRAGTVTLTAADRRDMAEALRVSSNDATHALWTRHDGPGMPARLRDRYGMTGLTVVPGYDVYWRHLRCTAEDLQRLMSYVLDRAHPQDRAYLVAALRGVAANQHWGVWAAGPGLSPGHKAGWAFKPDRGPDRWVTHTVGFAGPGERYVVAAMYEQPPGGGGLAAGVQAVSDAVALVFGAATPARVTAPA